MEKEKLIKKKLFWGYPHKGKFLSVTLTGRGLLYVPLYVKKVFLVVTGHVLVAIF
jgi:hypothetical protein